MDITKEVFKTGRQFLILEQICYSVEYFDIDEIKSVLYEIDNGFFIVELKDGRVYDGEKITLK